MIYLFFLYLISQAVGPCTWWAAYQAWLPRWCWSHVTAPSAPKTSRHCRRRWKPYWACSWSGGAGFASAQAACSSCPRMRSGNSPYGNQLHVLWKLIPKFSNNHTIRQGIRITRIFSVSITYRCRAAVNTIVASIGGGITSVAVR